MGSGCWGCSGHNCRKDWRSEADGVIGRILPCGRVGFVSGPESGANRAGVSDLNRSAPACRGEIASILLQLPEIWRFRLFFQVCIDTNSKLRFFKVRPCSNAALPASRVCLLPRTSTSANSMPQSPERSRCCMTNWILTISSGSRFGKASCCCTNPPREWPPAPFYPMAGRMIASFGADAAGDDRTVSNRTSALQRAIARQIGSIDVTHIYPDT
jgi:hypothetical protein